VICGLTVLGMLALQAASNMIPALQLADVRVEQVAAPRPAGAFCAAPVRLSDGQTGILRFSVDGNRNDVDYVYLTGIRD
jgi:hypothetical protein